MSDFVCVSIINALLAQTQAECLEYKLDVFNQGFKVTMYYTNHFVFFLLLQFHLSIMGDYPF